MPGWVLFPRRRRSAGGSAVGGRLQSLSCLATDPPDERETSQGVGPPESEQRIQDQSDKGRTRQVEADNRAGSVSPERWTAEPIGEAEAPPPKSGHDHQRRRGQGDTDG